MKQSVTVIILAAVLLLLPSCTREKLFDRSELSIRLSRLNESYSFSYDDIICEDNISRVFYSLSSADDVLLSMTQDNDGRLLRVELTMLGESAAEGLLASYEDFCAALTEVFLSESQENARELCAETGLLSREEYFTDFFGKSESGRYTLRLWSSPVSMSYIITYTPGILTE